MPPSIQLIDVSKVYGADQSPALRHVSLEVSAGEFVALMGPSGCGKSTMLNIIGAIDTPTSGQVFIETQALTGLTDAALTRMRRERLGFVFQFFNLLSTLTVEENITLPLALAGRALKAAEHGRVQALMTDLGITHRAGYYPARLSGGEMQRVAIARAIVHTPAVILADEPTGNLDSENGKAVLSILQALCRDQRHTLIMATHSDEAAAYASRVIRMRDGQILDDRAQ